MDTMELLQRFERVRQGSRPNLWNCACPCKDRHKNGDRNPSARLWIEEDSGRMSFWCAKGCRWLDAVNATGTRKTDWYPEKSKEEPKKMAGFTAIYDYCDVEGNLLYQVCRSDPKSFTHRRPIPGTKEFAYSLSAGNYTRNTFGAWEIDNRKNDGIQLAEAKKTIYRLPEILDPKKSEHPIIVCEGEKDVERVRSLGLLATCNSGGAGKWASHFGSYLHGRRVCVIADSDSPGIEHACIVAASAIGHMAASVRIWSFTWDDWSGQQVPEGSDLSDWLDRQDVSHLMPTQRLAGLRTLLISRIKSVPEWRCAS